MADTIWASIGCGDVLERKSGPPLYEVAGCQLQGVYRRDADKGKDFAKRHGNCRYYPNVDELLADPAVTAVYVATHPDSHEAYTIAAAKAGKHVLVEKEMATDADACSRMIAACDAAGVSLGVAFYRRCYPSMLALKELIDTGALGELHEMQINDQFPLSHRLDLAHFFLGPATAIAIHQADLAPDSHATHGTVLTVTHANGATSAMNIGWHESGVPEKISLRCTAGTVEVADLKGGRMSLHKENKDIDSLDTAGLPWTHWGLIENFAQHLRGTATLACPGAEGRRSQVIEDIVNELGEGADRQSAAVDYRDV